MGDSSPPPYSPQMTPDQFMGFISSMTPEQRYMCQTYWDSGSATPATATPGPSAPQTVDPTPLDTPIPTPYIGSPAPSRTPIGSPAPSQTPIGSPAPSGSTPQRRLGSARTQRRRSSGGGCCGGSGGTDASTPPRQRPSLSDADSTPMGSPRTPWGRTQGPDRSKVYSLRANGDVVADHAGKEISLRYSLNVWLISR